VSWKSFGLPAINPPKSLGRVQLGELQMIDKAYILGVEELRELCRSLSCYSIEISGTDITVTRHDNGDGLNDICFKFPVVANFGPLDVLFKKNPEFSPHVCLHVFTGHQIRDSLYLENDGGLRHDPVGDWERFWKPLEAVLAREFQANSCKREIVP
jgi:hypothetical protein